MIKGDQFFKGELGKKCSGKQADDTLPENGNTFRVDARFMFKPDKDATTEAGMSNAEGPTLEKAVELAATKALELISERAASRR